MSDLLGSLVKAPLSAVSRATWRLARRTPPYRVYRRANWLMTQVPGAALLRTGPRTVSWMVKARRRGPKRAGDLPPVPHPTAALAAQVAIDEAVLAIMMRPSRFPSPADYGRVGTEVAVAAAMYQQEGIADPGAYHLEPPALTDGAVTVRKRRWLTLPYEQLSWTSGFSPRPDEPGAERWEGYEENHTAHALVLRHPGPPRPWLVCLHGFEMGYVASEFAAFRVGRLHHEHGLNVAVPIMPLHGPRKVAGANPLLSFDLMNTVFGMSHAVWDTRRLLSWIRAQGAPLLGLHGQSLGSYLGSLVAGFEPLDLAVLGVPVVDFPELFRHHAPHRVERTAIHEGVLGEAATIAHRPISPLAVEPRVPHAGRFIYAGLGDRMVPPVQPHQLWRHWGAPSIRWYPGSHVTFMMNRTVQRFVTDALEVSGFTSAPREVVAA